MSRRARVRKCGITNRWEVTLRGGSIWDFIRTIRFDTWRDAYTYADRWARGEPKHQSDYALAGPS